MFLQRALLRLEIVTKGLERFYDAFDALPELDANQELVELFHLALARGISAPHLGQVMVMSFIFEDEIAALIRTCRV